MQLELPWYPPSCVRAVLSDYLAMRSDGITQETRDEDYRWRVEWLLQALGEMTPAALVDFGTLERAARRARGIIRDVTIRRRLRFWRAAVRYAAQRGLVPKESIPELPPWLKDDGRRCEDYYTLEQYQEFRLALPPGRFRRYVDLAFWTGMHTLDVCATERRHLEPRHPWEGTDRAGRWWRRNHKNASPRRQVKVAPCYVPMEPELTALTVEWLAEPGPADGTVVGKLNNLRRTFHEAAARCGLPLIRPNLGLRASHSTLLMSRGYSYEYVRLVLGHIGEVRAETVGDHLRARTSSPSTLSRHYLRSSPDTLRPPT
jgi:hypothetical protein